MSRKIKLTKLDGLKINGGKHKVQPNTHRITHDYGVPTMRGCAFPSSANPFEKRGMRLGNIHKMYKFKSAPKGSK